jgi:hypothetical protein
MPFSQSYGTVINKPIGIIGKAIDLRSQFYDVALFSFRDYANTAEVLSWLDAPGNPTLKAEIRSGGFPVYVTAGGVRTEYWFQNGTADVNLVRKDSTPEIAATKSAVSSSTHKRIIVVEADESNNGDGSLYIHNGTALVFLLTIPVIS